MIPNPANPTIRYPLSAIRYPLSAIRYPPSAIRYARPASILRKVCMNGPKSTCIVWRGESR